MLPIKWLGHFIAAIKTHERVSKAPPDHAMQAPFSQTNSLPPLNSQDYQQDHQTLPGIAQSGQHMTYWQQCLVIDNQHSAIVQQGADIRDLQQRMYQMHQEYEARLQQSQHIIKMQGEAIKEQRGIIVNLTTKTIPQLEFVIKEQSGVIIRGGGAARSNAQFGTQSGTQSPVASQQAADSARHIISTPGLSHPPTVSGTPGAYADVLRPTLRRGRKPGQVYNPSGSNASGSNASGSNASGFKAPTSGAQPQQQRTSPEPPGGPDFSSQTMSKATAEFYKAKTVLEDWLKMERDTRARVEMETANGAEVRKTVAWRDYTQAKRMVIVWKNRKLTAEAIIKAENDMRAASEAAQRPTSTPAP